jgi:hypothetical protein
MEGVEDEKTTNQQNQEEEEVLFPCISVKPIWVL